MRASVACSIKDSAFGSLNTSDIRIEINPAFQASPFQFIDVTSKNGRQATIQWSKSTIFEVSKTFTSVTNLT